MSDTLRSIDWCLSICSGSEIDSHDMVLRFNSAPTKGFERLVGSKTTHRITNTQNWVFRESDSEHIMVHMRSASSVTAVIRTHIVRPSRSMSSAPGGFRVRTA